MSFLDDFVLEPRWEDSEWATVRIVGWTAVLGSDAGWTALCRIPDGQPSMLLQLLLAGGMAMLAAAVTTTTNSRSLAKQLPRKTVNLRRMLAVLANCIGSALAVLFLHAAATLLVLHREFQASQLEASLTDSTWASKNGWAVGGLYRAPPPGPVAAGVECLLTVPSSSANFIGSAFFSAAAATGLMLAVGRACRLVTGLPWAELLPAVADGVLVYAVLIFDHLVLPVVRDWVGPLPDSAAGV